MVTAKDVQGVMAMMPSFSTQDAASLNSKNTIEVDNLKAGVDRMINDGVDVITTTGSFGECYNLDWDEYKTLAVATVDAVKKRVPLFIGSTSPNAREVVERLKFVKTSAPTGRCSDCLITTSSHPTIWLSFTLKSRRCFPSWVF
jgi:dihydrodipicolinate synthase/N-acetylneuraminate lyase